MGDRELAKQILLETMARIQQPPKGLPTLYGVARRALEGNHVYHDGGLRECPDAECRKGVAVLEQYERDGSKLVLTWKRSGVYKDDVWEAVCGDTTIYAHRERDRLMAESDHFERHGECPSRPPWR